MSKFIKCFNNEGTRGVLAANKIVFMSLVPDKISAYKVIVYTEHGFYYETFPSQVEAESWMEFINNN